MVRTRISGTIGILIIAILALSATVCAQAKNADFNGNGEVDFSDFVLFAQGYEARQGEARFNEKFDLNGNGEVDFSDFVLFAKDYGKILLGTLATIVVTPDLQSVTMGATQQYMATGRDANGNEISISPVWSVEAGGGTISSSGLFTAGAVAGTYANTVKATSGSISKTVTVTVTSTGPVAVNLGTAGNYAVLAKSAISATGTTSVVGDLGLSPAAASFITGFTLSAPPTTSTTSPLVTGLVYASDYDPPTPANLTTAVSDMETAYTDAAGRTLPDFTELGAGDISGLNLVPGLYKWGTGVSISASGVTLTGGANAVWILQVAQDLTVANAAIVTLSGGAQAKNVFWQVAGQVTLGTTSQFKGIILSQTLISFNTGATITGRALAQTAVTLNATAVTSP